MFIFFIVKAAPREEATDDMVFGGAGKWTAVERRRVVTTLGELVLNLRFLLLHHISDTRHRCTRSG